jgi:hypothetical protein
MGETIVPVPKRDEYARARSILFDYDLEGLLAKHEEAIEAYMQARRQHAEARRLWQDAAEHCAEVELDALLEMEQDPDYVPGKNAEQRKQQGQVFLAKHHGLAAARHREKGLHRVLNEVDLEVEHARQRIDHLELQIAARRSELDLIASFARGVQ